MLIRFGRKLLTVTSQAINALALAGHPDESICGRVYRERRERLNVALDWLFAWYEPEHCKKSHLSDLEWAKWITDNRRIDQ